MREFMEGFSSTISLKFWGALCGSVVTVGVPVIVSCLFVLTCALIGRGLQNWIRND